MCVLPTERHQSTGTSTFGWCTASCSGTIVVVLDDTLDHRRVHAVLDHHRLERRAADDRLADDGVLPAHHGALARRHADTRAVHVQGAVVAALDVVLAAPHHLERLGGWPLPTHVRSTLAASTR